MLNSPRQTFLGCHFSCRFRLTVKVTLVVLTVAASAMMMMSVMTAASRAVTVLIAKSGITVLIVKSGAGIETGVLSQGRRARQNGKKDC
jgi:hypothetical protein